MNDIMGLPPEDLTAVIKATLCNLTVNKPVDTESKKLTRKAAKRGAKLTMAIWAFTLFLAAAAAAAAAAATFLIFNMHTKKPAGRDDGSFDIHHTLRQLSQRADAIRAAIHLTGQYNPDFANSVQWMNQVDPSHSQGGLELKDNQIIIPEAGLYFVYSQVSFRVSCRMDDADAAGPATSMVHLTHRVRRWSSSFGDDEYRTILHSVRTACQKTADGDGEQVGGWYSAVYVGAVFNLNRGDRLKTVTEKMLPNLEEEAGKTFFGAFAL